MRIFLLTCLFELILSIGANAQFHAAFGVGLGDSRHADSYIEEEFFSISEFSGFRALILEARVHYTFPTETSLYTSLRFSPNVTTISPYKYTYVNFGLEQMIPGTPVYVTGGYGKNKASTNVPLANGNLWLVGVGIQSEFTRFQLSYLAGRQQNQMSFLRENEQRLTLTFLFSTL